MTTRKHMAMRKFISLQPTKLTGDIRKIFVSNIKTVDESNSVRVLIGCKSITYQDARRVKLVDGLIFETNILRVSPVKRFFEVERVPFFSKCPRHEVGSTK